MTRDAGTPRPTRQASWRHLSVLAMVVAALGYPYETTVAPGGKIRIVDEAGTPMPACLVREFWRHYSVEAMDHREDFQCDQLGKVTLPQRVIRASITWRLWGALRNVLQDGVHASLGPWALLIVWSNGARADVPQPLGGSWPELVTVRRQK